MAFILNSKKGKLYTIHGELLRYARQLLLTMLLLIIASLGIYSISVSSARQENQQLFLVNDFYTSLQETENLLYTSILNQDDSNYMKLMFQTNALISSLEKMADFRISTTFLRDIEDLIGIMENYQEQLREIHQFMLAKNDFSVISQAYHDAEAIYYVINGTFHSVYTQVVSACQEDAHRTMRTRFLYTLVLLATIALILYYIIMQVRRIEHNITTPIQQLIEELRNMDLDNFYQAKIIQNPSAVNDDIQLLIHVYNSMIEKIQKQLQEREEYVNTKLKLHEQEVLNLKISNQLKKSELMNLQMQINPHFLFNTLGMISQSAYLANDRHTVSLCETTSDLLRYALDYSDKAVSIDMEMKHLDDYVYLLEQRFGDRICFRFDLDESFHQVKIPNLILQPILENAIVHGVGMYTEGGKIFIETEYLSDKNMGRISIIDNGEGMDEETLKKIDSQMRSLRTGTGKIGLSNVFFRLSIFFDRRADIVLSSVPHVRTEIAIFVPCDSIKPEEGTTCIDL